MSTPSKKRTSSITSSDVNSIRHQLRDDFETQIHRDIAVETFVQAIWGLDKVQIRSIVSHTFQFDAVAMQEYDYKVKNHQEPTLYEPFSRIACSLIQSYLDAKDGGTEPSIRIFQRDGKSRLAQTNANLGIKYSNGVKPDMLMVWTPSEPSFRDVQTPAEFKKTQNRTSKRQKTTLSLNSDPSSAVRGSSGLKRSSDRLKEHGSVSKSNLPVVDEERTWAANERSRENNDEDDEGDLDFNPRTLAASGSKRKRPVERGGKGPDGGHTLTHDESQLASYALECFAASSRHFVAGIFIKDYAVNLWYYDRMGAARTVAFKFGDNEVQLLGLVLVALHMSDATRSGFSPFLHCAPSPSTDDRELYSTATAFTIFASPPTRPISETLLPSNARPPSEIKDAIFRFPCVETSGDGKEETVFRVFSVVDILYSYRGLNGRGTQTFSVNELISHERLTKKLVAKLLWSSVFRAPETRTLSHLSDVVPELKAHLPEVVFACVYDSDKDLHLPRYDILPIEKWSDHTVSHVDFEKRDLAVIVMKKYDRLWNVETLDEFKDVFVDLVECHHRAYSKGRYLHRDISETNLMIDHDDGGVAKGVLCDWDLASELTPDGKVPRSQSKHRTGTQPFLAVDLLDDAPSEHFYRHDLESFFYILIWAGLHYSLKGRKSKKTHPLVTDWADGSYSTAQTVKSYLHLSSSRLYKIIEAFTPEFASLGKEWIVPLQIGVFFPAYQLREDITQRGKYDLTTLGGHITFEKFMTAISRTPRWSNTSL